MMWEKVVGYLHGRSQQCDICYHSDDAGWALDWVAHYIVTGLARQGVAARRVRKPWGLKHKIIHFGSRYTYLDGPYAKIDPTNHVVLTWFHGDPSDPLMAGLFDKLRNVVSHLHTIVTSCETSRRHLLSVGIPDEKIVLIPIGVDLTVFRPPSIDGRRSIRAELGIPEDKVCIGSFQKDGTGWGDGDEPKPVKGPDVFLKVVERLAARYDNLFVLLTGPARGYVKHGLEQLGVPFIHHFLDDYHALVRYYHAIDLYIITSRDEGGPKALLEGWATGVPIISTRMGMSADLIRHGENGMIANVDDVENLTLHTMAVIDNSSLRAKLREQALADVCLYDWMRIAEQYYHKLYEPILSPKPD